MADITPEAVASEAKEISLNMFNIVTITTVGLQHVYCCYFIEMVELCEFHVCIVVIDQYM